MTYRPNVTAAAQSVPGMTKEPAAGPLMGEDAHGTVQELRIALGVMALDFSRIRTADTPQGPCIEWGRTGLERGLTEIRVKGAMR